VKAAAGAGHAGVALTFPLGAAPLAGSGNSGAAVATRRSEQASCVTGCLIAADGGAIL
jgi:hypothetical protein